MLEKKKVELGILQKKDTRKVILVTIFVYNIVPITNRLFPATEIYSFLTDLWILNPVYAFVCSLLFCRKYGFKLWIVLLIAILFVPTMLIFYNSSTFIFVVVYFIIAVVGCVIGAVSYKGKTL